MSRFYDEASKWRIYARFLSGETLTQLCDRTGITDKPLREWFREFERELTIIGPHTLEDVRKENARIRKVLRKLHTELTICQNSILFLLSEPMRILAVQNVATNYGVNPVCRTLKIRKSNLYYHTLRKPKVTTYEKHNQEIRPVLKTLLSKHEKKIGAEKLRLELMNLGHKVSKKKVLELVRELRPMRASRKEQKAISDRWKISCENILARHFSPSSPNMVWVSDITEIKTSKGTLYLCVILDLFARKIVGARLSNKQDAFLVICTFNDAFNVRGQPKNLLFHSDQGGMYTAVSFRNLLHSKGVTQSFSAPGVPYDNAPMESFFASLKTEEIHRYRYRNASDLTASLRTYFDFYHDKRLHFSLNYRTPNQVEQEYIKG